MNGVHPGQLWRFTPEYARWQHAVFVRDSFKCTVCKQGKQELHAHHIKEAKNFPQLRFKVHNGITLCKADHNAEHKKRAALAALEAIDCETNSSQHASLLQVRPYAL